MAVQGTNDQLYEKYGRTFSTFGLEHGIYALPIDAREQERLDALDNLIRASVIGRSTILSLPKSSFNHETGATDYPKVLECGSGSGIWVEKMLQEHDGRIDVTAVDICFVQGLCDRHGDPRQQHERDDGVPKYARKHWDLNVAFGDDRSRDRWMPETFDAVHSRFLADGIDASRWQAYVGDLRKLLKKGGWIQLTELLPHVQSDNGRLSDGSYLNTWWLMYSRALTSMGKNARVARQLERMLANEGFDPIGSTVYNLPIGSWHHNQILGSQSRAVFKETLLSLSLWPLLHHDRVSPAHYRDIIAGAIQELHDDSLKLYYKLYIAYGQTPAA